MRNAEFDREQVLRQAMHAFMANGYSNTSMQDLTKATGLHPGSIYCAFENKQGLLLAAIEQYHQDRAAQLAELFQPGKPLRETLPHYLAHIVDECLSCSQTQACLLLKMLGERVPQDEIVATKVQQHLGQWQARLQQAFQQAIDTGELTTRVDAASRARYLTMAIYGMRTYAHMAPTAEELQQLADMMLQTLLQP